MYSILYVDDEPGLLEIAKLFLEQTGEFSVGTSISAENALGSMKIESYDAIISDYQMPGMDGIAFLKAVRSGIGDVPFILFTGRGREEVVIDAINNGADFYLQKGGDPKAQFAELAHKVRQAVARREAERSLVESEKRLADIINFLPDATFAIDPDGRVIAWNRAIEEMTGTPAADMIGKGDNGYSVPFYGVRKKILIDLIFEPDDVVSKDYSHISRDNDILIADTEFPRPMGRPSILMAKASPLCNRQGEIVGAIESIRDITALKRTEEGLSRARKDWETIFRAIGHPAFVLDAGNRIIDANDATLRATGMSLEDLKGNLCYRVFHGPAADGPPENCPLRQMMQSGHTKETEIEALGKYYSVTCTPVYGDDGAIEKVIHIAMDVSERRRAEHDLHAACNRIAVSEEELRAAYEQISTAEEELRGQYDELARNERVLRERENAIQSIFHAAPVGIGVISNRTLLRVNERFSQMTGYPRGELEGRTTRFLYRNDADFAEVGRLRGQAYLQDEPPAMETTWLQKDGTAIDVRITAAAIDRADPDAPVMYTALDITTETREHKELVAAYGQLAASEEELREQYGELAQSERRLRESEEKYRTLIENSGDGFFIVKDDLLVFYNRGGFAEMTGYTEEELIGRPLAEIIAPEDRETVLGRSRNRLEGGSVPASYGFSLLHRDGTTRVPVRMQAVTGLYRGLPAVMGTIHNIAQDREREDFLKRSEQKYRALIGTTGDGFVIFDTGGRVVDANPEYVRLTGHTDLSEIAGRNVLEWTAARDSDRSASAIRQCLRDGSIRNFEVEYADPSGLAVPVEISAKVFRSGGTAEILSLCRDITRRKQAEDALRIAKMAHFLFDAGTRAFLFNDRFYEMIGTTAARAGGYIMPEEEFARRFVHPDSVHRVRENIRNAIETANPNLEMQFESRYLRGDGMVMWLNVWFRIEKDASGKTVRFSGVGQDITERKQAEEALRESEERLAMALDATNDALFDWDIEKETAYHSPRYSTMLGFEAGELSATLDGWEPLLHPEDRTRFRALVREYHEGKRESHEMEVRVRNKEGDWRWILSKAKITAWTAEGRPVRLVGTHTDITDRKRAEEALRESEERYKKIFESFVDIYFEVDKDGIITTVSPSACTLGGWKPGELIGKPATIVYQDPSDRARFIGGLERDGALNGFETMLRKRDGTLAPVSINARPCRDARTGQFRIIGSIHDISGAVKARNDLKASEEKYRHILENMQDAYFQTDCEGRIVMVSPSAVRLYGYDSAKEMIGMNAGSMYRREEERRAMLQELQEAGKVADYTGEALKKDGTTFWVSLSVQYIRDGDGTIRGTEAIVRDITGRRMMEHSLTEANKKLNLLSSITRHDVANQLTILRGYAQIARMKKPGPVVSDFLVKIEDTARTIAEQLAFTKTYQDLGVKAPAWFRIGEVVSKTATGPVTLSGTCRDSEIFTDPMLESVFFNLFDNAVRHGGNVTEIAVRCERAPDGLVIVVEDDGTGIPPGDKEKIFAQGFGKNTGFGLFLVREILSITGITIRETGSYGNGARFEIRVPEGTFRSGTAAGYADVP